MIAVLESDIRKTLKHLEVAEDALIDLAAGDDNARATVAKITVIWAKQILEQYTEKEDDTMKEKTMNEETFFEIRNHFEIAEDGLKELAFEEKNEVALSCKNEILDGLRVLDQWFYDGHAWEPNIRREI